jgi:hypothetical protein
MDNADTGYIGHKTQKKSNKTKTQRETKKMSNMHMDPTKKTVNPGSHESPGKTNI